MYLARVVGPVVAPVSHPFLEGRPLLLVERLDPEGVAEPRAPPRVALDRIGAGPGDVVLVLEEGNSARQIVGDPAAPLRSVVAGFVDEVETGGRITLRNGPRDGAGPAAERAR